MSHGPWYVARKDVERNLVYISRNYHNVSRERSSFLCTGFSWLGSATALDAAEGLRCKVRHGPGIYDCSFTAMEAKGGGGDLDLARVDIQGKDHGFAPGQYAVFYDGDRCLGSAVIR